MDLTGVPEKSSDEAWVEIAKADKERDLGDLREVCILLVENRGSMHILKFYRQSRFFRKLIVASLTMSLKFSSARKALRPILLPMYECLLLMI